jgi:hypothetical protein
LYSGQKVNVFGTFFAVLIKYLVANRMHDKQDALRILIDAIPLLTVCLGAPEWCSGLRHCISVLEASLQTPWFHSRLYHNRL